jgi:hypothetical protein
MQTYKHNLSYKHLFSCNMGEIIPFCHEEVLPGDLINMSVDGLIRFSPLVTPVMHRITAHFLWVFVPTRVIDDTFPDFITGGEDGNDTTTLPTISTGTAAKGTIYDYLNIPIKNSLSFLAHPVRAYNSVYNELFRDPDLQQTEVTEDSTDIQFVQWERDYFTLARPSEQKGTAVTISLGDEAPIKYGANIAGTDYEDQFAVYHPSSGAQWARGATAGVDTAQLVSGTDTGNLKADLNSATGIPINDLREAWAFHEYQENRYKYGSRFVEYCEYLFGGNVGDARLQRPELLGSSSVDINISEVLQTAPDSGTSTNVGELKGHGIAGIRGRNAIKHFGEHGQLLGLMYIRPESIYFEGIPRKFSRASKEDFYQPEFARIGAQPILKQELYADGTGTDAETYGYTPRYREYSENLSRISGDFRDVLDTWHLARQLGTHPTLNSAHISTSGTIRNADIFASTTNDTIYVTTYNRLHARRIVLPPEPMTFIRR